MRDVKCRKFREWMSLELDERLDEARSKALGDHVSRCARCARALEALKAAEATLRSAGAPDPGEKYWASFSRRVMTRIDERGEMAESAARASADFGRRTDRAGAALRRIAASLLPPAPGRWRLAAGVASLVVVIAAGVLYVERRGEGIVPPELRTPLVGQDAMKAANEVLEKKEPAFGESATEGEAAPTAGAGEKPRTLDVEPLGETEAEKAQPLPVKPTETEPLQKGKSSLAEETAELPAARPAPTVRLERSASSDPAAPSGAESFSTALRDAAPPPVEALAVTGRRTLARAAAGDTLVTDDELRRVIDAWTPHVESHPGDPANAEGFRQVAEAYVHLAARTGDAAVIEEGASAIRSYLERSQDAAQRSFLAGKLREIESLRKK